VTNYVSLLLQRETNDPLYAQISTLQQKWEAADKQMDEIYDKVADRFDKKRQTNNGNIPAIIISLGFGLLGLLFTIIGGSSDVAPMLGIGIPMLILGVIIFIAVIVRSFQAGKLVEGPTSSEQVEINKYHSEKVDYVNEAKRIILENEKQATKK
jgi:hypothetical protein